MTAKPSRPRLGIVCGLASEARVIARGLRRAGVPQWAYRIGISGADSARARAIAMQMTDGSAHILVSAGLAGGLRPDLGAGDTVFASDVRPVELEAGEEPRTSAPGQAASIAKLRRVLGNGVHWGVAAGCPEPLLTGEQKAAAYAKTAALTVDMESHEVAREAATSGCAFLAVRTVVDPASHDLPPILFGAIAPSGRPRFGRLLAGLFRHPHALAHLVQLARASRVAHTALERAMTRFGTAALSTGVLGAEQINGDAA